MLDIGPCGAKIDKPGVTSLSTMNEKSIQPKVSGRSALRARNSKPLGGHLVNKENFRLFSCICFKSHSVRQPGCGSGRAGTVRCSKTYGSGGSGYESSVRLWPARETISVC